MCREKIETIGAYLRIHSVPNDLRERVIEFYEYLYTSGTGMEDLHLLKDLPPSLASRLAVTVHRRIVTRASVFASLSDRALLGVLARLSPVIFVPGQVVQLEGHLVKAMYFIKRGRVQMLRGLGLNIEKEVRALGHYENFGLDEEALLELELTITSTRAMEDEVAGEGDSKIAAVFTKHYARESARALTYCDAVSLSMPDLVAMLKMGSSKWGSHSEHKRENDEKKRSIRNNRFVKAAASGAREATRMIRRVSSRPVSPPKAASPSKADGQGGCTLSSPARCLTGGAAQATGGEGGGDMGGEATAAAAYLPPRVCPAPPPGGVGGSSLSA